MSRKSIKVDDADASQLMAFAVTYHGIEVSAKLNRAQILAKLRAVGFDGDEITVDEVEPGLAVPRVEPVKAGARNPNLQPGEKPGRYVTLTIASTDKDHKDPQFVSVNGVNLIIPRNKPCRIPYRFFHALQNALRGEYDQDEKTLALTDHRLVPTVPMIVHQIDDERYDTDDHERDAQEKWNKGQSARKAA